MLNPPREFWVVRHLKSTNNKDFSAWADDGDDDVIPRLCQRTGNTPLCEEGVEQGDVLHELAIREGWDFANSVCLTSSLLRGRQSTARMRWPNARWMVTPRLRERIELPPSELVKRFASIPPGVDRRAALRERGERFLETDAELYDRAEDNVAWMCEEYAGAERVVMMTHRFKCDATCAVFEGVTKAKYLEYGRGKMPSSYRKIENGNIIIYSNRDPKTGVEFPGAYPWMRFIDPFCPGRTDQHWVPVGQFVIRSAQSHASSLLRESCDGWPDDEGRLYIEECQTLGGSSAHY